MDTTTEAIDQAQSRGSFDVLAFIEETAYPTEKVVVFQDVASATEYVRLNDERAAKEIALAKRKQPGEIPTIPEEPIVEENTSELDAKIEELGEKIRKSSIVFELRGMAPGVLNDMLMAEDPDNDNDKAAQKREDNVLAATIVGVENHEGIKDTRVWDAESINALRRNLKEGEFGKLVTAVARVNFNAAVFDQATDAGFSGRGSDLA